MKPSSIGWCDFSGGNLNFVSGCTPVSEGCANCYAAAIYKRWGKDFSNVVSSDDKLDKLLSIRFPQYSPKRGAPHKPMAFVCDTGDLFHPSVRQLFVSHAFTEMQFRNDVIWIVLTKRPERIRKMLEYKCDYPAPNIWLGVTAENQARADERIPILLNSWPGTKFVSIEPMLEPVDVSAYLTCPMCNGSGWHDDGNCECGGAPSLDWVICGAESGPNRRPFEVEWAKELYEQCKEAGVAFYGKQDSGLYPGKPLLIVGEMIREWPRQRAAKEQGE
jgi:protein gp37